MPRHGWRRLVRRRNTAEYAHAERGAEPDLDWVEVEHRYGRWSVGSFGGCAPERVVRHREVAWWGLRLRQHEKLDPSARVLRLEIETGTCYPGSHEDPARRLRRVEAQYTHHHVGLLVLLKPEPRLPKGYACAGVGLAFPQKVKLRRTLGHRALVDLRTVPSTVIDRSLSSAR
jgi:hypothetical protein